MKCEADFKNIFKKSVTGVGGYCKPLAAPVLAGIPDLYCIVPGFMPVLLEAKWLGVLTREKFRRKIQYSALQDLWLTESHKVQPYSAMGLIGYKYLDDTFCTLLPPGVTLFSSIDHAVTSMKVKYEAKSFDVNKLFSVSPIPEMYIHQRTVN